MGKTGIITFHDADNVGAVLQGYALQESIKRTGKAVEIIDYSCEEVNKTKKSNKSGVKGLLYNGYYWLKNRGFNQFRNKYLDLSANRYDKNSIREANSAYDTYIAGSDQIWNLSCSGNDLSYFLDFAADDKKKYSYAASLGAYKFTQDEQRELKPLLDRFDTISVREKSAVDHFKEIDGNYDVQVNADPVLLLDESDWKKVMTGRIISHKYVLVYLVQQDVNVIRSAEEYARKNGCKIVNNKKSIDFILHNSPSYFLSWIYYADAVFTNSFHGTAFSVLFNKKLAADIELKDGGTNNRVNELLSELGADSCIIRGEQNIPVEPDCKDKIKVLAKKSLDYINEISAH